MRPLATPTERPPAEEISYLRDEKESNTSSQKGNMSKIRRAWTMTSKRELTLRFRNSYSGIIKRQDRKLDLQAAKRN